MSSARDVRASIRDTRGFGISASRLTRPRGRRTEVHPTSPLVAAAISGQPPISVHPGWVLYDETVSDEHSRAVPAQAFLQVQPSW